MLVSCGIANNIKNPSIAVFQMWNTWPISVSKCQFTLSKLQIVGLSKYLLGNISYHPVLIGDLLSAGRHTIRPWLTQHVARQSQILIFGSLRKGLVTVMGFISCWKTTRKSNHQLSFPTLQLSFSWDANNVWCHYDQQKSVVAHVEDLVLFFGWVPGASIRRGSRG